MKAFKVSVIFLIPIFLTSCLLKTRQQVENEQSQQVMSSHMVQLQKKNADSSERLQEFEDQLRVLSGRIDVLEKGLTQGKEAQNQQQTMLRAEVTGLAAQMKVIRQALSRLDGKVAAKGRPIRKVKKGNFSGAEDAFSRKDWKTAILGYQKYLDLNPKGKYKSRALYRTGVCFEELGNAQVARTFYQDAVDSNPKSSYATKAKKRLKQAR